MCPRVYAETHIVIYAEFLAGYASPNVRFAIFDLPRESQPGFPR